MLEYSDNIKQVTVELSQKLKKMKNIQQLQRRIANYLYGSNIRRIHVEGLAVNGSPIGEYSTDPLYLNPSKSPRKFATKGKHGDRKFKNGKPHKTAYFGEGWKGFRGAIGRETGKVNLQLSGKLKTSWAIGQEGRDYVLGFNSEYGSKIASGQEGHFGKPIWGITSADQQAIDALTKAFVEENLKGNA